MGRPLTKALRPGQADRDRELHRATPRDRASWRRGRSVRRSQASLVKTDCRDARGIAHLLADGVVPAGTGEDGFRTRAARLLGRPRALVWRVRDLDNSVRSLLRGFGLRPPRLLRGGGAVPFARSSRASSALGGHRPDPGRPRQAVPGARAPRKAGRDQPRDDAVCRRLWSCSATAVDDSARFRQVQSRGPCARPHPEQLRVERDRSTRRHHQGWRRPSPTVRRVLPVIGAPPQENC
jgi:hypothetical protein